MLLFHSAAPPPLHLPTCKWRTLHIQIIQHNKSWLTGGHVDLSSKTNSRGLAGTEGTIQAVTAVWNIIKSTETLNCVNEVNEAERVFYLGTPRAVQKSSLMSHGLQNLLNTTWETTTRLDNVKPTDSIRRGRVLTPRHDWIPSPSRIWCVWGSKERKSVCASFTCFRHWSTSHLSGVL